MSKIDEYKQAKARADVFRNFLTRCTRGDCDKFGAEVKIADSYMGFYGNSSCGSWPDEIVKAVAGEIKADWRALIRRATENAEREAEKARRAAADEAREVLAEVTPAST